MMMDYSELNLHLVLSDQTEDEDILYGFAIRKADQTSLMLDLEQVVRRYGGVTFEELLMNDVDDSSLKAAIKTSKAESGNIERTIEVEPLNHQPGKPSWRRVLAP